MTCYVSHTTIDCRNAYALSEWWKPVLGYTDLDGDPNLPDDPECMIRNPESGTGSCFVEVPDPDLPAKRIHLTWPRVPAPGTARWPTGAVGTARAPGGSRSPTRGGNQFCVVRSPDEH